MRLRTLFVAPAFLFVALTIKTPVMADTLTVNGVCEVGTCGSPTIRYVGTNVTIPFDITYQFANSDLYKGTGNIVETFSPSTLVFSSTLTDVVITYEGNSTQTSSSHTDVFTVVYDSEFDYQYATPLDTYENLAGEFGDGLGVGTSVSGQTTVFGDVLPLIGPITYPPQTFDVTNYGTSSTNGTPGLSHGVFTLAIDPGTQIGASLFLFPTGPVDPNLPTEPGGPSAVPEPSTLALLVTGFLGAVTIGKRRRVR